MRVSAAPVVLAMIGMWLTELPAETQPVLSAYYVGGAGEARSSARREAILHAAAGLEAQVAKRRLGLGGEIGYLTPARDLLAGGGVLSLNAAARLRPAAAVVPFATAGYSLLFRVGARLYHAGNVGAGLEWSVGRKVALRLELRDHMPSRRWAREHLWAARAGLTFW